MTARPHHSGRISANPTPTDRGMLGAKLHPMTDHDRLWSHTKVARLGRKEA